MTNNSKSQSMKKTYLLILTSILFQGASAQTNFKWEKVDSTSKSASQIYSDTKMFIAETWKSSKDVIQNDDKEAGVILVKGSSIRKQPFMMGEYVYIYNYSVTFKMKDNKFKITLDNVYCESAYMSGGKGSITKVEPFDGDNCPETGTFGSPGLPRKKAILMMNAFREDLQMIVDSYVQTMKKESKKDEW